MSHEAFATCHDSVRGGSIAIFLPSLTGGGAQRAMVNLATGFASRGWRTDMVLARATGVYLSEVGDKVRVVDLAARRTLSSLPGLAAYLRTARPTVLLTTMNHANVVATWARRFAAVPTRLVLREANTASLAMRRTERLRDRLVLMSMRSCYRSADGIVAVSDGVAEDLSALVGLPRAHVEVIYNPVVTEDLAAMAAEPLHHPWLVPGSPPVILAVGRLHHQKDYKTLIRAFQRVRSRRPARLLILGEGKDRFSLEALVRDLGIAEDVSLPGFVQNPFAYMSRSAMFVLSSAWEGLPAVLIQALACGAPIVSTDCPSGPREILRGGEYGDLVPVGDSESMATAIERCLDGPRRAQPSDSWQAFTQDAAVERYLSYFATLCDE